MMLRLTIISTLVLILASAADAQTPESRVEERVEVRVIEIPVNVVTRTGEPVAGLEPGQFEIVVDGRPQTIIGFEEVKLVLPGRERRDDEPAAQSAERRLTRRYLLLFDLVYASPKNIVRARRAAEELVTGSAHPDDLFAVATYGRSGVRWITPFSRERTLALTAIRNLRPSSRPDPLRIAFGDEERVEIAGAGVPEYLEPAGAGADAGGAEGPLMEALGGEIVNELSRDAERRFIWHQVESLRRLALDFGGLPGQKQVIFLSEGFDAKFLHGVGRRLSRPDARGLQLMQEMFESYRKSGILLHTIDIRGIRHTFDISSGDSLFMLARDTGGMRLRNRNDPMENFHDLFDRQSSTYLLTFRPEGEIRPDFNQVEIRLNGVARGTQVHAPAGFYGITSRKPLSPEALRLRLADIVLNDREQNGVRVRVEAGVDRAASEVAVRIEIPGIDLVSLARGETLDLELFAYLFSNGHVVDLRHKGLQLDLTRMKERLLVSPLVHVEKFGIEPGDYTVKVLIRLPESDLHGFARTEIAFEAPAVPVATYERR